MIPANDNRAPRRFDRSLLWAVPVNTALWALLLWSRRVRGFGDVAHIPRSSGEWRPMQKAQVDCTAGF
jgi:hypothetical protein